MIPYAKSGVAGSAAVLICTNRPRVGFAGVGGTDLRATPSFALVGAVGTMGGSLDSSGRVCFDVEVEGTAVWGLDVDMTVV